ncbi:carbohydrate binding domain-containing protein [Compostimonas suwonensis]|uniref:Carbohydrate binding protein n=1 Tax=Compostimonas suwonensis TaxID=1048394 RepID=A0A2M9BV95_9MICO|nr:carbohydrate binding domain-containing protein [Compostimonas suwonensis]PJJ61877.1 carbohydrate binding protein [Compostimonas suwonensis]
MKRWLSHTTALAVLVALLGVVPIVQGTAESAIASTPRLTDPLFTKVPQATALTTLDMRVQYTGGDSTDAVATARVLQGLVNRTATNKVYLLNDAIDALHEIGGKNWNVQEDWITNTDELTDLPRTALARSSGENGGLRALVDQYSGYINGVVIWDPTATGDVDVATFGAAVTIAAQTGALAVSPDLRDDLVSWGYSFPVLEDLRDYDFDDDFEVLNWSVENYWAGSNQDLRSVFSLGADSYLDIRAFNEGPIDYAVATNGFAFDINMVDADDDAALMGLLDNYVDGETAILGWIPTHPGGTGFGETPAVLDGTSYYVLGGNGLSDFSVYGSFPDSDIDLPDPVADTVGANDVYVGLMLTDGDALHCVYRGMFSEFTQERTSSFGEVPITWSIAPQLANLAPPVYNYFAENLPEGSDLTIGWADKVNRSTDTGLTALAEQWRQYADLSDIHTVWTVHSQEDSQRSDLVGWDGVAIGYTNSQIPAHPATLRSDTAVLGTWNFGYDAPAEDVVAGIQDYAGQNPGAPLFMMVTMGAPFSETGSYYDKAKDIADALGADPQGRNYKFVGLSDMAATYSEFAANGGIGGGGAGNLMSNGGFELNPLDANGWGTQDWNSNASLSWATDQKRSGLYSAKVSGTGVNAGFNRDYTNKISIGPSETYTLGGWMKTDSVSGTGAWVWTEQLDSLGNVISGTRWDSPQELGTNDWNKVSHTFTAAPNAANMNLYVHLNGSGTVWYDDMTLASGAGPVVSNSGFESDPIDANGWDTFSWSGSPAITWATDQVHGGSRSLRVTNASSAFGGVNRDGNRVPVEASTSYTLEGWVRTDSVSSPTGEGAYWAIGFADAAGNWIGTSTYTDVLSATHDWTQVSATVTSPANAAYATIGARLNGTGTAWFDDVTLE